MVTLSEDPQGAHFTKIAAEMVNAMKLPGEAVGLGVMRSGELLSITIRLANVGLSRSSVDADDDAILAAVRSLLEKARARQADFQRRKAERLASEVHRLRPERR